MINIFSDLSGVQASKRALGGRPPWQGFGLYGYEHVFGMRWVFSGSMAERVDGVEVKWILLTYIVRFIVSKIAHIVILHAISFVTFIFLLSRV